jgi:glycerol-3-phosphate acyltransferase PlsY
VTATGWLIAVVAYLVGSIPFGLLVCRWVAGVDLRAVGSGNIGATNATRVVGKTWGAIVLLLDALKGLLPTLLLPLLCNAPAELAGHYSVLAGLCAILGHSFPIWLGFRGGKGVATSLGVIAILAPWGTLVAAGLFVTVFAATRIVSASSLAAAIGFAVFQWFWLQPGPWSAERWSLTLFSLAVPLLIVVRHRSNIVRLLRGEEAAFRSAP